MEVGAYSDAVAALSQRIIRHPLYRRLGWALGPVWKDAVCFAAIRIRSPDRPARSESQCRLRHPDPKHIINTNLKKLTTLYGKKGGQLLTQSQIE
jgi:hypothetical protein